jgi:spore protease
MEEIRTDLAVEICDHVLRNNPSPRGIQCKKEKLGNMTLDEIRILNAEGEKLFGKPRGTYRTLNTGKLWLEDRGGFREKVLNFADLLHSIFQKSGSKNKTVLVAGLGNRSITADAIGPIAVENLVVTRHIRNERPLIFEELGLAEVCALMPGVLGQTGIESADVVRSVVEKIKPDLLLCIDALASRSLDRLVTTIQLCDSGIRPGSGIGNTRPALIPEEIGIPVISIGVPTVVDAATLAADVLCRFTGKERDAQMIREEWNESNLNFFVTPKETDQIIRVMGSFIGYGINLALNRDLSFEDMLSLIG